MKYRKIISVLCMCLVLTGCSTKETKDPFVEFKVADKIMELKQGEIIEQNWWNGQEDAIYTDSEGMVHTYDQKLELFGGVTMGTSLEEVLIVFEVEPYKAMVNREISAGDGCTDVVIEPYETLDFLEEESVLDALFTFVYQKVGNGWVKLDCDAINKVLNPEYKDEEEYLVFRLDFVGEALAYDEIVDENCLIEIMVEHTN